MPRLFDEVVLLVDCEVIGPEVGGRPRKIMPRGSRGVLVDQNTMYPHIWTIEFSMPSSSEMVLVEADQKCVAVSIERSES